MTPLLLFLGCSEYDFHKEEVPPPKGDVVKFPSSLVASICSPLGPAAYVYNTEEGGYDSDFVSADEYYDGEYNKTANNGFGGRTVFENGGFGYTILAETVIDEYEGVEEPSAQFFMFPGDQRKNLAGWFTDQYKMYSAYDGFTMPDEDLIPAGLMIGCRIYNNFWEDSESHGISYFAGDTSLLNVFDASPSFSLEKHEEPEETSLRLNAANGVSGYYWPNSYKGYIYTNTLTILDKTYSSIDAQTSSLAIHPQYNVFESVVKRGLWYCDPNPAIGCHE